MATAAKGRRGRRLMTDEYTVDGPLTATRVRRIVSKSGAVKYTQEQVDLRTAKAQAKLPGSTDPGRRGVGRDRAKPDTSTYEGRFAARLGELAKAQGFEPTDLAQRLNVSDQVVYDWLAGRKMPAVGRFPALAKLLKCKHPGDILPPK